MIYNLQFNFTAYGILLINYGCIMQYAMHHPATTNLIINTLNTSQQ